MWYYGNSVGAWIWMTVMMLVFWGGLIAIAVWAVRSGLGARHGSDEMRVLRHRLAAGEISQDDFEKTKRALRG
jgi:putative membrane protein